MEFEWSSGTRYPDHLEDFDLVVHCGACMISRREMLNRIARAGKQEFPSSTMGFLALAHGVLKGPSPFPEATRPGPI